MKHLIVAGISAFALFGFAAEASAANVRPAKGDEEYVHTPLPPGIQVVQTELDGPVFADATGHTLYVWPYFTMRVGIVGDARNNSACTDQIFTKTSGYTSPYPKDLDLPDVKQRKSCVQVWPPVLAPADAKPVGNWSVITRADGKHQWAYNQQAVYTSELDLEPGDMNGGSRTLSFNADDQDRVASRLPIGPLIDTPPGFSVSYTPRGRMLLNAKGYSIYMSDRDGPNESKCNDTCARTWIPMLAGAAVKPHGNWSVIKRAAGVTQWAFQGHPLYTYSFETRFGGQGGTDVPGWHNVYIKANTPPAEFTMQDGDAGTVLADHNGKTIYIYNCTDDAVDQLACDHPNAPQDYRFAICGGLDVDRCLKRYPYVPAGASAKSTGRLWTIMMINPRTGRIASSTDTGALRVWAYRGRPIYTNGDDKEPGDTNGHAYGEFNSRRNGYQAFWLRDVFFNFR